MLCSIKWFEFLKNAESSQHKLETAGLIAPPRHTAHTTQCRQLYSQSLKTYKEYKGDILTWPPGARLMIY